MADNYEFGNMRSEMIRDCLVISICDHQLSEWLQMEPELTLAKAENVTHQRTAIGQQQQKLKAERHKFPIFPIQTGNPLSR